MTDELSEAKAEIARLRKALKEYARVTTPLLGDSKSLAAAVNALKPDPYENSKPGEAWNKAYQPTEDALVKAKAEIARLTAENQQFKKLIASEKAWLRSLEPDTGEKPSPLQAIADILAPFTFKGVKPDTAKAEIARLQNEVEEWRRDYDRGTKMSDLSAEVRSEINHWRGRAEQAEADIVGMRSSNTNLVAERDQAKAEIARLTMRLEDIRDGTGEDHIRWLAKEGLLFCRKPDTGETP